MAPSLARYNLAPSLEVYATFERDGQRRLGTLWARGWSHWSSNPRAEPINARNETLDEKPSALARRRCVISADGF